jgi:broad-specificity NMP kinase
MNFILIAGPPAVGKMTVGQCLASKLDYKLFHNHQSIDHTLQYFDWGTPEFKELNEGL